MSIDDNLTGWVIPDWAKEAQSSMKKIYRVDDEKFIIFRNNHDELDWMLFNEEKLGEQLSTHVDQIFSEIMVITAYIPNDIEESNRNKVYMICAEALAAIFNGNILLSNSVLVKASDMIKSYKYQKYICSVLDVVGQCWLIITCLFIFCAFFDPDCVPNVYKYIFSSFCIGTYGAMASIIFSKKDIEFYDVYLPVSLQYETVFKIILGGIFGVMIYFVVSEDLVSFIKDYNFYKAIPFIFLSGFSERFAPSVFNKMSKGI